MAFWWDLLQQYQIGKRKQETGSIDERVSNIEQDIADLYLVVERVINKLDELDQAKVDSIEQSYGPSPSIAES